MMGLKMFGLFLYDLLVPHIATEWVACDLDSETGEAIPGTPMQWFDHDNDPEPDLVVKISSVVWLLNAWNWGQDGDYMTYREWCQDAERQKD